MLSWLVSSGPLFILDRFGSDVLLAFHPQQFTELSSTPLSSARLRSAQHKTAGTKMAAAVGWGLNLSRLRLPDRRAATGHQVAGCSSFLPPQRAPGSTSPTQWCAKQRLVICLSVDIDDSATEGSTSTDEIIKTATEELQQELNPRRGLEERYAVINTGLSECRSCGYVFDSEKGDSNYPIPGGIPFSKLPEDWRCPTCGAAKSYFQSKGLEVAGFAQNQSYGLGGNSLTEGQKSLLIYGSLVFFFGLFLAGYLLQ